MQLHCGNWRRSHRSTAAAASLHPVAHGAGGTPTLEQLIAGNLLIRRIAMGEVISRLMHAA